VFELAGKVLELAGCWDTYEGVEIDRVLELIR
jgi:hypothetical protein